MIRDRLYIFLLGIVLSGISGQVVAQGQLDPIRLNSLTVSGSVGSGAHYFGNGAGFGPAIKGVCEKGMWDLGPGIVTLGGELTISYFSQRFGDNFRQSWTNIFLAGRGVFHYGWDVEGLDTYVGIPAGIGFCGYSDGDHAGSSGAQTVFPYAGLIVGASWFFNKNLGVNGELGYNSTYSSIGVIWKIR